jgi:hypothetical protein
MPILQNRSFFFFLNEHLFIFFDFLLLDQTAGLCIGFHVFSRHLIEPADLFLHRCWGGVLLYFNLFINEQIGMWIIIIYFFVMKLPLYYVWLNDVLKLICLLSALFLG